MSIRSLAVMGRCCAYATIRSSWECGWCWMACLTTVAIPMPGLTGTIVARGEAAHDPESPWRDWYSFSDDGTALDSLGYATCRSWIMSRKVW